ncbi:MAG: Crp/Fnr family transcriptional regulator [Prevotellaceae bacterium]|jgi:CRP-like cAMP-binding protein|nr:Crp/Fnr family transcriptional regulator [Prevotellaceae bacterium]
MKRKSVKSAKDLKPIDEISSLWDPLTQEERIYLRENTTYCTFRKNELIYSVGEEPVHLIYLISGMVKIYKDGVGERSQIVRMAKPGDHFAYRAYLANEMYHNTAKALESSSAYLVPVGVLGQIIQSNSKMSWAFIRMLAKRLGVADTRLVTLSQKHLRGRLAEILVSLRDNYGTESDGITLHCRLTRQDMAFLSNMTTSNVIRTLAVFSSERIIEVHGRTVRILDEDKLRSVSKLG